MPCRPCGSFDALTSPQQPILPNPANWSHPKASTHNHKCSKQNSQHQLYQCNSECSDHSLKSHSQNSQSSQERSKNSNGSSCKEGCQRSQNKHQQNHTKSNNHCNGSDVTNGNHNIYENDDEASERDHMITNNSLSYPAVSETDRHSDCCSSMGDGDADTCCSCSESSCLYAEASEPGTQQQQPQQQQPMQAAKAVGAQN